MPTNNKAERSIRKAVLWRKVSLGVDSEEGARFVERMLTLPTRVDGSLSSLLTRRKCPVMTIRT